MSARVERVPCFLNVRGGSAAAAREVLAAAAALDLRLVEPGDLLREVQRTLDAGVPRVAVCGGDGTLATAAAAVARAGAELAPLPGGTLNHFCGHLRIPTDLTEAARIAARSSRIATVDVGWMNGERLVLNTSSLGAYVSYVRTRERIERWLDYYTSSAAAALHTLWSQRGFEVELHVDGEARRYATTLVFVGIGEREVVRGDGAPCPPALRGLHVMVARAGAPLHMLRFAIAAWRRGTLGEERQEAFDSYVTDACVVHGRRARGTVAIDGELVRVSGPVRYELERDALRVVVPE
ncbi:MAG: diacylglycerol/lipid kinase family protein [Gemmatimonadaceae bacterium]